MSRRARVILLLLILAGAGIAAAIVLQPVSQPGAFVLERTFPVSREDLWPQVAFVPGKESVLYGARRITIFDLTTGTKRELSSDPSHGRFVLSADGASAAVGMPGPKQIPELWIYDLASGKVLRKIPDPRGGIMAWSPDGRRIVFAVTWMLFVLDLDREVTENHPVSENHSDGVDCLAFSPDGRLLGLGTRDGEVSLWRTDSWTLVRKFDLGSGQNPKLGPNGASHVTFSPDGALFAAGGGTFHYEMRDVPSEGITSGAVRVWRTSDHTVALSLDPVKPVVSLSFSPDGSTLAYSTWKQAHVVDLVGLEIWQLEARRPTVEFGRDGRLLTLDEREGIRIWKRAPQR